MDRPRLHLIAPAGSCRPFFPAIGVGSAAQLIAIVQQAVGSDYLVTGDEALIEAVEDGRHGGRTDDRLRAEELEAALGDDAVTAIVSIRGGAWFTRILPLIDFTVLDRRTRPVAVFGFSELTTLVNIVGASARGIGVYDMGPAFLTYALKRHAGLRDETKTVSEPLPDRWMLQRVRSEFDAFFYDVVAMIEGRGTSRPITARLERGELPTRVEARFVGGNLTVLSVMVGSAYADYVEPAGRWLVLEDFNDKLERVDRFLAHLTLAGYWDACEGILLGDFHNGYEDLTPAVLELLDHHLSPSRPVPILVTGQVGHVWPMSPLPLHVAGVIERKDDRSFVLTWPAGALRTVTTGGGRTAD